MLSKGRNTNKFFSKKSTGFDSFEYELKSREQYSQENNKNELPRKKYFPQTTLKDIILQYNNGKPQLSKDEIERRKISGSVNYLREEEEREKGKIKLNLSYNKCQSTNYYSVVII
jgi:dual specificity protein kinase YAK1